MRGGTLVLDRYIGGAGFLGFNVLNCNISIYIYFFYFYFFFFGGGGGLKKKTFWGYGDFFGDFLGSLLMSVPGQFGPWTIRP